MSRSLTAVTSAARGAAMRAATLLACCAIGLAAAPTRLAALATEPGETIIAGVISDWPPYYLIDEAGEPSGFAVEVLDAVAARAGLRVRYRAYDSFIALQRALAAGEVDVVPSLGVVEGRDFRFTAPIDTFDIGVFVRESAPGVRSLADLSGRIAVVESNVGEQLVVGLEADEVVVVPDVREAIFRLLAGDFEALIFPSPVIWALARGARVDHQLVELEPALAEVKRALAVSLARPELHARLDAALAELVGSAEYGTIYRRWHAPPTPYWTTRRVLGVAGVLVALLAVGVAVWRYSTLRRFHRELGARERTFRALAEGLADCVMIVEPGEDIVRYANSRSRDLFGRPPEELIGRSVRPLLPAGLLADLSGAPHLTRLARADGTEYDAEVTVGPSLLTATPPGYLVRVADVSARRRADERIRFQAHLLDVVAEAVIATDLEGRVVFWNRFAEQLYGWPAEEAIGLAITELTTPPESVGQAAEILAQVFRGEAWSGEFRVRRRDGSTFPAWVVNAPVHDERGAVAGIVGISTDLSARRELEERLRQAQKMESVGRLAGGIAHDFNNLLTVITGNVERALHALPPDDPRRPGLVEIELAADRAAALTQQLLAFGRKQVFQPRIVDLNAVLLDVETLLRRLLGERIELSIRPEARPASVRADPAQLEQVIVNLAVNGRDAMPFGGRLTIETATVELAAGSPRLPPGAAPGGFVRLKVSDTGSGMDEATRDRIFEPFFTTKAPGEGSGLGLATVYGIVQQSGGAIEVESAPGAGSTFRVFLPASAEAPRAESAILPPRPQRGRETILLVEDESSLRQLFERSLEEAGYTVLAAGRPTEALRLADTHDGPIELLLTDVVLPEMNGAELAERLAGARPELRVLFMSGYAGSIVVDHGVLAEGARLLSKPFTTAALGGAVREVLDSEP